MHILILAAGEGKRMKSNTSKVLHKVCQKSLIDYVICAASKISSLKPIVVVGHKAEQVMAHIDNRAIFVTQSEQLGTGHAVMQASELLSKNLDDNVIILSGDTPLISGETLFMATEHHIKNNNCATVISARVENPFGYGRIIKDEKGSFVKIVEQKDANDFEKNVNEINSGMYIFKVYELFSALSKISNNNSQGEYYLTDTIEILLSDNKKVDTYTISDYKETLGINDRIQLAEAQSIMQDKILKKHMANGVTIISPSNTYIGSDVEIEKDSIIYPLTILEGNTKIGEGCIIGPNTTIKDSTIQNNVEIINSVVLESKIDDNTKVGPFAYIRPNSSIGKNVKVGDFVEVKNSKIGNKTKISHLTYVGDSVVGENVNFGCGTVTVNYDGTKKYTTTIEDDAFIGCNTNLIAPVTVKKGAYTAAGSTITDEVPEFSLAIARSRQVNKENWRKK